MDSLSGEVIFHPESSTDSADAAVHTDDGPISQTLINRIPKELEQGRDENPSGIILATTPTFSPRELGTHEEEAYNINTSFPGRRHSSVHVIPKESLLERSHITMEEQLKESNTSMANEDFLIGE